MFSDMLSRWRHWVLVGKRRYIYHIVSVNKLESILRNGNELRPRGTGCMNEYANPLLVEQRNAFVVEPERLLRDAVPFYLSPRQPMFCRLVREKRMTSSDIVALGFDFENIQTILKPYYVLYSTNPVYSGGIRLQDWTARSCLDWTRLRAWRWNNDRDTKDIKKEKSAFRQAELDIFSSIPLQLLAHIVTDVECPMFVKLLPCERIVIRNLNVW